MTRSVWWMSRINLSADSIDMRAEVELLIVCHLSFRSCESLEHRLFLPRHCFWFWIDIWLKRRFLNGNFRSVISDFSSFRGQPLDDLFWNLIDVWSVWVFSPVILLFSFNSSLSILIPLIKTLHRIVSRDWAFCFFLLWNYWWWSLWSCAHLLPYLFGFLTNLWSLLHIDHFFLLNLLSLPFSSSVIRFLIAIKSICHLLRLRLCHLSWCFTHIDRFLLSLYF